MQKARRVWPLLHPLRARPRFQAIERALRFPDGVQARRSETFPLGLYVRFAEIEVLELNARELGGGAAMTRSANR